MTAERWKRLEGLGVEKLRDKSVLVVGLGSGGSTVALELAKAGVGRLTLVDYDRLDAANVIRHECDDRYVGATKVAAVADLIRRRNPEAAVEAVEADAFTLGERLARHVAEADLVAGCTDVDQPKHLLNRLCLSGGVSAVYGGVYAGGVGGEVIRCPGPEGACYACVISVLKETAPPAADEPDYGVPEPLGVPALGLDVRLIALLHAKLCLHGLLGEEHLLPGNVVLFGTARVDGLFPRPFASGVAQVAPQADCLVCGPVRLGATFDLGPAAA